MPGDNQMALRAEKWSLIVTSREGARRKRTCGVDCVDMGKVAMRECHTQVFQEGGKASHPRSRFHDTGTLEASGCVAVFVMPAYIAQCEIDGHICKPRAYASIRKRAAGVGTCIDSTDGTKLDTRVHRPRGDTWTLYNSSPHPSPIFPSSEIEKESNKYRSAPVPGPSLSQLHYPFRASPKPT